MLHNFDVNENAFLPNAWYYLGIGLMLAGSSLGVSGKGWTGVAMFIIGLVVTSYFGVKSYKKDF